MESPLIGREAEQEILKKALQSPEAEMVAVVGRRRVGKTFLIKSAYKNRIAFEITGIQHAPYEEQMHNFVLQLNQVAQNMIPIQTPKNWLEAFHLLTILLEKIAGKRKQVVFFDELPWLAARKSGFIRAFGYFWNSWAVKKDIVVVICGSAASWMIKKVINDTGGLYNRVTRRIYLKPFDLSETERFFKSRKLRFDRYQIAQLYMAMGGIPHYLKEVESGKSAVQNINSICFAPNGILHDEFEQLYPALFAHADNHLAIVRTLAKSRQGMTRQALAAASKVPNGGGLTTVLKELIQSDFISVHSPFGKKKKEQLYRLSDEYSLFYLKFIEGNKAEGKDTWHLLSQTQGYNIWAGYAFENICLKHIPQIKKALGISGVYATTSSFYKKGNKEGKGAQIDLLIDRNDRVINICEIKFHQEPFSITKVYAENLRNKMGVFRESTKTRKYLMLTFITTFGLRVNQHSLGLEVKALDLEDLFE